MSNTKPVLFKADVSANSVSCIAFNAYSDFKCEEKFVDLMKGESRTKEFMAMNPMHVCPTLKLSDDVAVWESNAVLRYMGNSTKKGYPADLVQRAKVDMILDYRQCGLYPKVSKIAYPLLGFVPTPLGTSEMSKFKGDLETEIKSLAVAFLKEGKFLGGMAEPTIADFSIVSALEFAKVVKGLSMDSKVSEYLERFYKAVPNWAKSAAMCQGYVKMKLGEQK
mmetsp:Transcript_19706/g.27737  ORF Transcript_19706/g.27737 Transcript_19706/m.27737 type:complete len:222 (+) Transcript_19706:41-706(+)|eukprot:CAMPEP_0185253456 /NCGR_PEP_ID=MMETSP1359-20130426/2199_1 /TAXON_ID=552665 /ORGANISM="Bigelowiella longifila, Strain CCMP242" /LENGTH=221 /DNA_ID=CAMNT_0027835837 /DNA_START=32 /DNA_END=697 /DNA_ORIENTATION=-